MARTLLFTLLFATTAYAGGPAVTPRQDLMYLYAGFIALMLAIVGGQKLARLARKRLAKRHF